MIRHVVRFRNQDAAETGVLHEAISALVTAHHNVGDDIDPQPGRFALADATVEQIDAVRNLRKQRIQRFAQNFEPGDFRIAQVDDDAGTIGSLDARLAERIAQSRRARFVSCFASDILCLCHRPSRPVLIQSGIPLTYQ